MSTTRQDQEFSRYMEGQMEVEVKYTSSALDTAIEYIGNEFSPDDVFSTKQLESWAESNGYEKI